MSLQVGFSVSGLPISELLADLGASAWHAITGLLTQRVQLPNMPGYLRFLISETIL